MGSSACIKAFFKLKCMYMKTESVTIKKPEEIVVIIKGGRLLGNILQQLAKMVKPGITTGDLESKADELIKKVDGRPSFKGYYSKNETPFPCILCTSINDEVVHAAPLPPRVLKNGDIVGIDIGMEYPAKNGFYTDTAVTVAVGKISAENKKLIEVTKKALQIGIKAVKPGNKISDIGRMIENYVKPFGYGIVKDLVGHGVGYAVHESPRIPNYFDPALSKIEIKEGMVLAIEPMIALGTWKITEGDDGFSIKTADGSWAAHFEHTIVVTKRGCEIVT